MASGVQIIWTPWRNHDDLLRVRELLFAMSPTEQSGNSSLRRKACDQISIWKLRGNLPHAVESTWLLTEALLMDEVRADFVRVFAVKATYITAISRFVTGLLDSQQDTKFKVSMYAKAQQLGLPAMFVDLRHEASHGNMPSLTSLRSAARRALQWLWEDYWKTLTGEETDMQRQDASYLTETDLSLQPLPELDPGVGNKTENGHGEEDPAAVALDAQPGFGKWQKWQGLWDSRSIGK